MLKSPKSSVGWLARKAVALLVAYAFFATSVWSVALPGEVLAGRNSGDFMSSRALTHSLANNLASPLSDLHRSVSTHSNSSSFLAAPNAVTSLASKVSMAMMQAGGGATATVNFFGPEEFVRTTGDPNTYTVTVQVPAWVGNPFNLHIQSGEADGTNRVSSATILVNNVQVAGTSDFNVNVFTLDRTVTLTPNTTLVVTLASKPGSYLKINLSGVNEDKTPPALTIVDPADSSAINTPQAHLDIHYQDLPGAGEPAASGVNVDTLQVLLDGVDRTSLFAKRSDEATADLPATLALAAGPHTVAAAIQDNAGNTAHATANFQVDLTPPAVQILQPVSGSYLNTVTPQIQIAYSDNVAVNTGSLHVTVNGIDVSSQFSRTATGATATLSTPLAQGANDIVATISDTAGNQTTASTAFHVDTTPPTITIEHPAAGSRHGSATVEFSIQFSDDQAIDLSSLVLTMDGNPLTATTTLTSASGSTTLTDGNHTLVASIKDKAGNQASASSPFSVDTALPDIHIIQPAPGAILNNPAPVIQVTYSDPDLDMTSLKITLDGNNITNLFTVTATGASGTLQTPLSDGPHTITAQVADLTGNVGQASSTILIDTIKPQITILAPLGAVKTLNPNASAQYSDSGSGIDPTSVHVFIDGTDVTGSFAVGSGATAGVLTGLAEGTHQFRVTVADKAGNVADVSASFLVDVTPPQASFSSPASNSFINTPQPNVVLNYSDALSGVDPASIHIFIQPLNGQQTEITSLFTVGAGQASGAISPALADGTYHLLAQVADKAGNMANVDSAFALDTVAPTYLIQTPAANAFLKTATPTFVVTYQDDRSGVEPAKFALRVDGVDRTNRMTANDTGASGTLEAGDALADGTHEVDVTVVDRAGNQAAIVQQPFLVDTTPPTIVFTTPTGVVYTNNNHPQIAVNYSDTGSGIDVTTFHLTIDGIDHTAEFAVTATGASGSPAAALPDGLHTVVATISDLAGNPATAATSTFTVDTVPPQVTITQPANGFFTNAASLVVSGTVVDASPVTVTVEGTTVPVQNGAFTSTGITLGTTATQTIHVLATDAAGNSTPVALTVNIDRTPPTITGVITPAPNGNGWNNTAVTVNFTCADDGSGIAVCPAPVPVTTEGANQAVTGTATDKAGNSAQVTVPVSIDETPPTIVGTPAPPANAAGWNTTDVVITYVCADSLSGVVLCPSPQVVSKEGRGQPITVSVSDKAGNTASSTVTLSIEKTAPTITGSAAPAPNAAGWNNTDVTVNFVCTPSASDIVTCQPPATVSTEGKGQIIIGTVTDQAGKTATTSVTVNLDKTPPLLSATAAPPANAAGWNNTDVLISYICSDSLSGIAICPPPATVSTEGAAQQISAQATDQAGNRSSVTTTLNIDKTPPVVTATAAPSPNGAGWNNTNVTVSFSCTDNLSGVASCPQQRVVATEGQNQNISGQATDVAGNTATGSILLSIDKTPPTIVQLSTPDHISRLHGGQVSVTVNDNFMVSQVVITVNGTALGTFTSAPYQADLEVPSGANPGDTLTVTAVATDEAGNTQSASRGVSVAADGVIVGQVLSDATSFPIQGAQVQSLGTSSVSDQTDDHGRYSLQASDSHLFVTVTSPATTTVEREVFVQQGVGTVPVDARLTPLATAMPVGSAGGALTAGNISITVPAGTVGDGTSFQLTPLTGQGLPGLLPLGWSPLAAFDLRATSSAMNLSAAIAKMPNTVSHLVTYNAALHAWTMVTPNLQAVSGTVTVPVPSPGAYALVVTDNVTPAIPIPNPGDALTGIDMQLLDPSASSSGSLSPAILPPTGGTSTATLGVQTTAAVPSGTVIQANISETFSLTSGDKVSEENRSEDIVLYGVQAPANSAVGAQFAVTPSRKYTNAQLLTGKVHLDILAGREGVRGQPGGSNPLTLSDGVSTLSVPGGALNEDTAISLQSISLEDFVPTTGSQSPVQEVLVDFSGDTLNTAAQLSISATGLNPADTYLLTMVQRIDGVPHMVLAALAQINGSNLTSVASPGLPGVVQGGEYVFYDIPAPMGFVQGTVSSSAGPVQSLVQTDSLQIVSITGADGRYIVPALAGSANLKASVPHTNLLGSASVQVTAGQTAQVNITLSGTVTSAVVSPADGTLGVPTSTTITITTTAPVNPQSIQQSNLVLLQGTGTSGTPVPVQAFVLSSSGTVLSFAPVSNLQPATQYTIQVSGLADTFGGAIVVPASSFTTKAVAPLNFDPNAITFSFPDQNGNINVSAPAGSLLPGTQVLIIDQTSGLVLSLTALNDGSVSGNFPGAIDDVIQVTLTDPSGATASFTRSQFVAPDGTTAVGSGGGTVTGTGGTGLIIPPGAVSKGTTFKVTLLDQSAFPVMPTFPGGTFGSGMHVDAPSMPSFNEEVKLQFPVPANAPANAFYYVYRRLTDQDGNVYFDTIDHAFVQGTGANARVVTASPPFCGYRNSYGKMQKDAGGILSSIFTAFQDFILIFEIPNFDTNEPGVASQGLIVGKALQIVPPPPGQTLTTFLPVGGAVVSLDSNSSSVATTDANCGTFTLFDPQLGGGLRHVTISNNGKQLKADVNEVNAEADASAQDATFGPFGVTAGLEALYKNIGTVNFTFPPPPVVIPPQININVFTLDGNNQRQPIKGIVTSGTPLVIAFATNQKLTLTGVSINQTPYAFGSDTFTNFTDNLKHYVVTQNYSAGEPGVYKIAATAQDPLDTSVLVTEGKSFLVVNDANGQLTATPGVAPAVIDTTPTKNALNVPTTTFPQISFSEPVTQVAGSVTLVGARTGDSPELLLIGVRADGSIANPVSATDAITSLTVQPVSGLQFNEQYTLTLSGTIVDQNSPPLPLPTYTLPFTTAGGQELGGTPSDDSFAATRPVVIGNRAYLGVPFGSSTSGLDIVDISDPTTPKDEGIRALFLGHALDASGQKDSRVSRCRVVNAGQPCTPGQGGGLVAVAAGQPATELVLPSNVYLYDVSTPDVPNRVGAVSVTTSTTQDGMVLRLFMKDQFLYTSTFLKGIQVVDLQQALDDYKDGFGTNAVQFGKDITTEGVGFANDSVVNTIPLRLPICANNAQPCQPVMSNGSPLTFSATMWDLKAGDFAVNNSTQTLVVATGTIPFAVVDPFGAGQSAVFFPPSAGAYLTNSPVQFQQQFTDGTTGTFALQVGRAVALGTFSVPDGQGGSTTKQVAVVVGGGTAPPFPDGTPAPGMLMVVDMTDPHNPAPIGAVQLTDAPVDLLLKGPIALIGTGDKKVLLVNLNDPTHPIAAGEIDGPTLGDHLALTDSGIIISSSPNPLIGGLHTAGLESECVTQRNNLKNSGPSIATISYPLKSLDWTINGGSFTPEDGYELTAVQLGGRLMANTMSLPYVMMNRTPGGGSPANLQCVLSDNTSSGACFGSPTSRSQKLSLTYFPSAGDQFAVEAKFLLDRLDGDHDQDPTKPDSCVIVTQHYEFWREGFDAPEASDELSAARFKPTVTYQYFTDKTGPVLNSFTAAQRFQFSPTAFTVGNATPPRPFSYDSSSTQIATLFLDCDPGTFLHITCAPTINGSDVDVAIATPDHNPMRKETAVRIIQSGQTAGLINLTSTTGDPRSPFEQADNLHLRSFEGATADIEGPTATGHPGCPECVHIHWRWGSILQRSNLLGALVVSPRFDNNNGNPIIPFGSNQDVDIGILQANIGGGHGSEEHPAFGQTYLDFASQKPINTGVPLSFWYSSTGHANQDSFMVHGGFFSSLKVSISSPGILTTNVPAALPFGTLAFCSTIFACTVKTDIQNRTGHKVRWTATLTDKGGIPVTSSTTNEIAGASNQEYLGTATINLPPGITLFPTYILDIKVVDEVTGWSTERQAYVTSGAQIIVPTFP